MAGTPHSGHKGNSLPYLRVAVFVMLCAMSAGLIRVSIDNRLERWIASDIEHGSRYESFRQEFGSDEFALIAFGGRDIFDANLLDVQLDVLEAIESLPMVTRVQSVATVYRDNFGAEHPEDLRTDFESSPFYRGHLISADGTLSSYFILVDPPDEPKSRSNLARQLKDAAVPLEENGFTVHHAGSPIVNAAMDETSLNAGRRTFPVAAAIAIVVLIALLRSVSGAFIAIFCSTVTTTSTIGLTGYMNIPLDMMTSVLPALLWVLTLANPIHIIRTYQQKLSENKEAQCAAASAMRITLLPCTLSSLTTAAGFLSLSIALLPPIREFGAFAAIGFVVSLIVSFVFVPWLLIALRVKSRFAANTGHATPGLFLSRRYTRPIVLTALLLGFAAATQIPRVSIDANPIAFFDGDSDISEAYTAIGDGLTGLYSFEVILSPPGAWLDPDVAQEVDALGTAIAELSGVTRVISPTDLLKKSHQWDNDFEPDAYRLPDTKEYANDLIGEFGPAERDLLNRQASSDKNLVRLTVLAHTMQNSGLEDILEKAKVRLEQLPPGYDAYTTGLVPRIVESQATLVRTQIRTLGLAFAVVFICILVGLRSISLTILSAIPNIVPILCVLATMAVMGIRLDVATVMTASVVLGIAVDDTVHLLTAYRREKELPVEQAWRKAVGNVFPAIFVTTVTSCVAFGTLYSSDFVPLRHFGMLASAAVAVALLADVVLLPAAAMSMRKPSAEMN